MSLYVTISRSTSSHQLQSDSVQLSQIKVEKPSEEPQVTTVSTFELADCLHLHQEPLAEDPRNVSIPKSGARDSRVRSGPEYLVKLLARLNQVNGVVSPSKLKPDQPPIKSRHGLGTIKDCARVRTDRRNKECPICGDWYPGSLVAQDHFISCVGRNGNPQGYYWDGALDDERRIGKEIAELYCSRGGEKDKDSENSTSDGSSSHDPRTMSYEPSESCSQASSSCSLSPPPSLRHDRNDYIGVSPLVRTRTDHGHERGAIKDLDEEFVDSAIDSPQVSKEGRAETIPKAAQVNASLWF